MSVKFEFTAQAKTEHGKRIARRMRRDEDRIPGVVYGAGKGPQSISLSHNDLLHAFENEAVFSHILKLTVDGKSEQVVIKAIQRHAYKPKIVHVDFLRVKAKEHITMNVPLHFEGEEEAPGVKSEGGTLTKSITEIEIRCLPADLPEFIVVDVSTMQLDETIHLSDLKLPSGVVLTQLELDEAHDHPVIACHIPKMAKADIEAEQHEAELAEEASIESSETSESEGKEGKDSQAESEETSEGKGDENIKDEK